MKEEILTANTEPNDGQDSRDLYDALFSKVLDMQIDNYYKTEKGRKLKEQIDFFKKKWNEEQKQKALDLLEKN